MRYLRCELHTHTVWSDGSMTPEELAANAAARGYDAIALTDHNTVFAYPRVRAAAEKLGLTVVPGIGVGVQLTSEISHRPPPP